MRGHTHNKQQEVETPPALNEPMVGSKPYRRNTERCLV